MTRGPAARVRALLEIVRPLATEVVMAVDAGGDPSTPDVCGELTDRLYVLESAAPHRVLGWLMHECSADWILRLDDDEVPSAALLEELPALLDEQRATNLPLSRRWLYPEPDRFITDHPWTPDYQIRLFRNLPGIWTFPGLPHEDIAIVGERRFTDLPIYHLDLLVNDLASRRQKAERYELLQPGHMNQGVPVNLMYTPEDVADLETAPVPAEDAALISAVMKGSDATGGETDPAMQPGSVERFFPGRDFSEAGYNARIEFVRTPVRLPADSVRQLEVEVENLGDEWWPAGDGQPEIRVSSRWLDPSGGVHSEGPRMCFTETVAPGRNTRVMLAVVTPDRPGTYTLECDLVHEHVRWFRQPVRAEVEIDC